jgi:hypothetical protein
MESQARQGKAKQINVIQHVNNATQHKVKNNEGIRNIPHPPRYSVHHPFAFTEKSRKEYFEQSINAALPASQVHTKPLRAKGVRLLGSGW